MKLKPLVFFPPFLCFALALVQVLGGAGEFFSQLAIFQERVLSALDRSFCWGTFSLLLGCVLAFLTPLGKVKIGGEKAVPILDRWRWFAVTLCTTVAVGLIFWGTAEPLFHFHEPPLFLKNSSLQARISFAISTLYFHWSLTPYAIYTVPALVFALAYYNHKKPFSLSAPLSPLLGKVVEGRVGELIDSVCLFALVAGMSASLGTGVLTLTGGIGELTGMASSTQLMVGILVTVVVAFVISAVTGVTKGIRLLSEINATVFVVLALFVLLAGPTAFIFREGFEALKVYFVELVPRSLYSGSLGVTDPWARNWTFFYWCNWLAWAPVTALFLGRISYGYTVRETILTNLILPSVFAWVWMAIFGGWALDTDIQSSGEIFQLVKQVGVEKALYALFGKLSVGAVLNTGAIALVVITAFLAYVTSAEANTSAMAAMSTKGISPENPEAPMSVKIMWGICIGLTSGVMISYKGIDGIKTLSILGGVPSFFLIMLILGSLLKFILAELKRKKT